MNKDTNISAPLLIANISSLSCSLSLSIARALTVEFRSHRLVSEAAWSPLASSKPARRKVNSFSKVNAWSLLFFGPRCFEIGKSINNLSNVKKYFCFSFGGTFLAYHATLHYPKNSVFTNQWSSQPNLGILDSRET